jgi:hypothetical protein
MNSIQRALRRAVKKMYHPPLKRVAGRYRGQLAKPLFIDVPGRAGNTIIKDLQHATPHQPFTNY